MIAVKFPSPSWPPRSKASHTEPSAVSLSPSSVHTWYGAFSTRCPAHATPTAIGKPWPSEPVATSTHGRIGVGCPSRRLPIFRNVRSSSSVTAPAARNIA